MTPQAKCNYCSTWTGTSVVDTIKPCVGCSYKPEWKCWNCNILFCDRCTKEHRNT